MKEIIFSPSLLSADFSKIADELEDIENAGIKWVHLDVMDGLFVPNITFGPPVIKSLRNKSKLFFDTHLMIAEPTRYIKNFAEAGADLITIHKEATYNIPEAIKLIKENGCKVGISFNPSTPLDGIEEYIKDIDLVLLMSVNPGFGGQSFIDITHKIKKLSDLKSQLHPDLLIEVDGGINTNTAALVTNSGADVLVAGSAIFGKPDRQLAIDNLKKSLEKEELVGEYV